MEIILVIILVVLTISLIMFFINFTSVVDRIGSAIYSLEGSIKGTVQDYGKCLGLDINDNAAAYGHRHVRHIQLFSFLDKVINDIHYITVAHRDIGYALNKKYFFKCENGEVVNVNKILIIRKVNESGQFSWEVVVDQLDKPFRITNADYESVMDKITHPDGGPHEEVEHAMDMAEIKAYEEKHGRIEG